MDSMEGICYLAHKGERKKLCHNFCKVVDLLLAVCMLIQEVADMLFQIGIDTKQHTSARLVKRYKELMG